MNDTLQTDNWLDAADGVLPRRSVRAEDAEMDITPMIDITFLLLIFFLVCSIPDQTTAIELPTAKYGKGVGERTSVIITLSDEGIDSAPIYLADGKIEAARLHRRCRCPSRSDRRGGRERPSRRKQGERPHQGGSQCRLS